MFLRRLLITQRQQLVREIKFREGVNLIIDETPPQDRTSSGNNVGKTTTLRVIDFCLGGHASSLYLDREFKKENTTIANFIRRGDADAHLEIVSPIGRTITVTRALNDARRSIDGDELSITAFNERLAAIIFGQYAAKPTFRQMIPKFVRIDPQRMDNVLHWLHGTTTKVDYETVWSFLFGFEDTSVLTQLQRKKKEAKKLNSDRLALQRRFSTAALQITIRDLTSQIATVDKQIEECAVRDILDTEVAQLADARRLVRDLNSRRAILYIKIRELEDARAEFLRARSTVSVKDLESLYAEVSTQIGDLTVKFADLQHFHNSMIDSRVRFVDDTLGDLREQQLQIDSEIATLANRESALLKKARSLGAFADLQKLHDERSRLVEIRGRQESLLSQHVQILEDMKEISQEIEALNTSVVSGWESVDRRVGILNTYLSQFSQQLFRESLVLVPEQSEKGIQFSIINTAGNEGTGRKRAVIAAFDLAYLAMLGELRYAKFPRFIVHDQVETIALNQLGTIFQIAESLPGQYIVAVLKDRVEAEISRLPTDAVRLRLSKNDRFFRLPD